MAYGFMHGTNYYIGLYMYKYAKLRFKCLLYTGEKKQINTFLEYYVV